MDHRETPKNTFVKFSKFWYFMKINDSDCFHMHQPTCHVCLIFFKRIFFLVISLEASLCPDVVVAEIDPKKLKKKQTVNVSVSSCTEIVQLSVQNSYKWPTAYCCVALRFSMYTEIE